MNQVWTYTRLAALLASELEAADLKISLYSSNTTPTKSSTFASFTIATDPVTGLPLTWALDLTDWTPGTDADGAFMTQPVISQVIYGPLDIYGFLLYDLSNVLKCAQRFTGAPISLPSGPNAALLTPACHANSP